MLEFIEDVLQKQFNNTVINIDKKGTWAVNRSQFIETSDPGRVKQMEGKKEAECNRGGEKMFTNDWMPASFFLLIK